MNEKRNWKIYFEWIDGKNYNELATEFSLSHGTVKKIIHSLVPQKVRDRPWMTANAYQKFREWCRKSRKRDL